MAAVDNARVVNNERGGELVDVSDPPIMNFLNIVNGLTHVCIGGVMFIAIFFTMNLRNIHYPIFFYSDALKHHIYLCVIGVSMFEFHPFT